MQDTTVFSSYDMDEIAEKQFYHSIVAWSMSGATEHVELVNYDVKMC